MSRVSQSTGQLSSLSAEQLSSMITKGFGLSADEADFLVNSMVNQNTAAGSKSAPPEILYQAADKLWTILREGKNQGNLLSKTAFGTAPQETNAGAGQVSSQAARQALRLTPEQITTILNRGINLTPEISVILAKYLNQQNSSVLKTMLSDQNSANQSSINQSSTSQSPVDQKSPLSTLADLLWKIIPKWEDTSGEQFENILHYFKSLGLEHENQLLFKLKNNAGQEAEQTENVKTMLLNALAEDSASPEKSALKGFLDEITGQQIWIQTGNKENAAYFLMHIPLQNNNEIYNCLLAVESSRKGHKMDIEHCHLALQVETEHLDQLGADLTLYDNKLHICLLNDHREELNPLIEDIYDQIKQGFADIGLSLEKISLKTYDEFPQFAHFLAGKNFSGVDIKG
ncbi:hypothetical protein [Dehalobacter restrictus]|uniref:Flagellar hook-length control protein FliK n=1 Tax=Dehalobacter restrictus (strain DSM 9455 / PER-K23) TaxID=871738 RepID=A0ABM5P975_DEHRP|nr:hypothetical protein [Dehalobacter restrictus]AHF11364.1 hypothetical protein DEHRE_08610 [Dehalobacter restrictus DSM 9455]